MQNRQGGDFGGQRRKNRVFAPVTLKMIQEASPRPDDVCEIDGDTINEVSLVPSTLKSGLHFRGLYRSVSVIFCRA